MLVFNRIAGTLARKGISNMNRYKIFVVTGAVLIWLKAAFDWAHFPLDIQDEGRLYLQYLALLFPPIYAAFITFAAFRIKDPQQREQEKVSSTEKSK